MPDKIPLVLNAGQIEQLQSGDALAGGYSGVPFYIPATDIYTTGTNKQDLVRVQVRVDGIWIINGITVQL